MIPFISLLPQASVELGMIEKVSVIEEMTKFHEQREVK